MFHRVACLTLLVVLAPCLPARAAGDAFAGEPRKVMKTDAEWARQLTRAQYLVCRRKATEPPFSGKYVHNHARGIYTCVCCDEPLFSSQAKFDSGTGWPSFWRPLAPGQIDTEMDYSTGEPRVEVMCHACGAHLGHVFNDGPPPTGLRYCINSVALKFVREPKPSQESTTTGKEKAEPASRASQSGADERPQQ